jgi:hypothetical protein
VSNDVESLPDWFHKHLKLEPQSPGLFILGESDAEILPKSNPRVTMNVSFYETRGSHISKTKMEQRRKF